MNTTRNNPTRNVALFSVTVLLTLATASCFAQTAPASMPIPAIVVSTDCNSSNAAAPRDLSEWQGNDLHKAILNLDAAAVRNLLKQNPDVNEKDSYGNTPLINALSKRIHEPVVKSRETMLRRSDKEGRAHLEIARMLLKHGADVNAKGFRGKSPLLHAVSLNDAAAIQTLNLLIENKADGNVQDNRGYTPLMEAARTNRINAVELLLKNGADRNLKNCEGKTARLIAEEYNFAKVAQVLD